MKKVLFYYKLFFSGGTEHAILKLIKKLYQQFDIYVAYDDERTTDIVLKEIMKYAKIINLNEIERISVDTCIWCSNAKEISFAEFANKVEANDYYYWCHMLLFETYPDLEFPQDLRENIKKFICVSYVVKKDIVSKYPELEEKCIIVENYLDTNEIVSKSKQEIELKVKQDRLNIATASRIAEGKRI